MTFKKEPQLQAVVRRVVARIVRAHGNKTLANLLEAADPQAVSDLGPFIDEAFLEWEKEHNIIALKESGMMWTIGPELEMSDGDGPLIHLRWGWDNESKVTMVGEDAFDLALEILDLFSDENGDPIRPSRPEYEGNAEISNCYKNLEPIGKEYMTAAGVDGYSFEDLNLWIKLGKPNPIPEHQWIDYPEDSIKICRTCSHWYYTDRDDFPIEVCPGKPIDDIRTTGQYDPRRSSALREVHRLDKLILRMKDADARQVELDPMLSAFEFRKNLLSEDELKRFEKERIGL